MTRALRSSQPASEELSEAVRWYEVQRPGLGGEFFDAVVATIMMIESLPEVGRPVRDDPRTRRLLVARFPYEVVYRLQPEAIVLVAIAHLKRRPGYWKGRG